MMLREYPRPMKRPRKGVIAIPTRLIRGWTDMIGMRLPPANSSASAVRETDSA
jgi:hypothetical protein